MNLEERYARLRDAAREHLEYCADASASLFRDELEKLADTEPDKVYVQGMGLVPDIRPTEPKGGGGDA